MKKDIIKRNLWVMAFTGLLAFLLLPTEMIAQRGTTKRGANDTYQRTTAKNRNTSATYNRTRTRSTATAPTRTRRSTATTPTRAATKTRRTVATAPTRTTAANRGTATRTTTRRGYADRTRNRANDTYTSPRPTGATATRGRAVTNNERNTRSNYRYTTNTTNDYCRNYYTGLNTWNRNFWNSVHYTPSYYDLTYRNFPFSNDLRAQRVRYLGQRYWLYDGIWFRKRFGRYHAVDAPIGLCIDALPLGGEMIWYRGDKYVIYRGTAYRMLPFGGFQVVRMLNRF